MKTTRRTRLRACAFIAALATGGSLLVAAPAEAARPWPGHPDRHLVTYTVRAGDTPSGLSVRYRAWTKEFIALNGRVIRVGEKVTIPVVTSVARKARANRPTAPKVRKSKAGKPGKVGKPHWKHHRMSRAQVRNEITKQARRRGVPVSLALAVAWQESGWRQPLVSSAGAVGVMQVLPSTGRWMSQLAGKRISIRDTHGNIRAGTMLLQLLRRETRSDRKATAAYYEGLAGIKDGWYRETRQYVRNVSAIRRQIERTGSPR